MATFTETVDALVASGELKIDQSALGRFKFWEDQFGSKELTAITADDVDDGLLHLTQRGKLRAGRGYNGPTGKPLAPSSINRYAKTLGQVFSWAKRKRIVRRTFQPPTAGLEMLPEKIRHDRYFTAEEIDKLLKLAKVYDTRWGKMTALIVCAYHTGLRKRNLLDLTWDCIDFDAGIITIATTKNGDSHSSPITPQMRSELKAMRRDGELVFGRQGRSYEPRRLWRRLLDDSGMSDRCFHSLRHSCGHRLATSGVGQGTVMRYMGHRSLGASARYMHSNIGDIQDAAEKIFA